MSSVVQCNSGGTFNFMWLHRRSNHLITPDPNGARAKTDRVAHYHCNRMLSLRFPGDMMQLVAARCGLW